LRWDLNFRTNTSAVPPEFWWVLVIVKDGDSANPLDVSDLAQLYTPEQNVMAFGAGRLQASTDSAGPKSIRMSEKTRTMRKMMEGDSLQFIITTSVSSAILVNGAIQFFNLF